MRASHVRRGRTIRRPGQACSEVRSGPRTAATGQASLRLTVGIVTGLLSRLLSGQPAFQVASAAAHWGSRRLQ